ncbi:hypothetical protein V12B01_13510 [Vibrio splendidus 12B01]|nr:hypothetical protein V12B01_13510 [Vibrio splendidus 12B01]
MDALGCAFNGIAIFINFIQFIFVAVCNSAYVTINNNGISDIRSLFQLTHQLL